MIKHLMAILVVLFRNERTLAADSFFKTYDCSPSGREVSANFMEGKKKLSLKFKSATQNRCIPVDAKPKPPLCPKYFSSIGGLDYSFPTGALFLHYTPDSTVFLVETLEAFHEVNPLGIANVVVSLTDINRISENEHLKKKLDQSWINLVPIVGSVDYAKWTRDIFRFFIKDGQTAILHLNYGDESSLKLTENTACEISRQCGFPYLIPTSMIGNIDPLQGLGLDSGGNLGVAPGGFLYRGTLATKGFNDNRDAKLWQLTSQSKESQKSSNPIYPILTPVQWRSAEVFKSARLEVLDLDTSFLYVGHVDEVVSIVKTKTPAPCDFAILIPSVNKAIELMRSIKSKAVRSDLSCESVKLSNLKDRVLKDEEYLEIAALNCIEGQEVRAFMKSSKFKELSDSLKRQHIEQIIQNNLNSVLKAVRLYSGCVNPKIIEVPTLFIDGKSLLPNQVNLLELNPISGDPAVIVARSFFILFDKHLEKSLSELGINTHFVNDLSFAAESGDVHCATNEIRLCSPQ